MEAVRGARAVRSMRGGAGVGSRLGSLFAYSTTTWLNTITPCALSLREAERANIAGTPSPGAGGPIRAEAKAPSRSRVSPTTPLNSQPSRPPLDSTAATDMRSTITTLVLTALALGSSPLVAAQDFSATHNVTSLTGTWSSGTGAVTTGAVSAPDTLTGDEGMGMGMHEVGSDRRRAKGGCGRVLCCGL